MLCRDYCEWITRTRASIYPEMVRGIKSFFIPSPTLEIVLYNVSTTLLCSNVHVNQASKTTGSGSLAPVRDSSTHLHNWGLSGV